MSTTLFTSLVIRGSRRVRLVFSGNLAAGAFTSLAYYSVTTADGTTSVPITVEAVFAISGAANNVELSVSADWTPGAQYLVTVTAVPTPDGSNPTASLPASIPINLPATPQTSIANVEPETADLDLLLFGRDLLFAPGGGFVEDATGDLATVTGRDNYEGAMNRRMIGNPLLWAPKYSPRAEDFVDAPSTYARPLAGRLLSQARADDRTASATVDVQQVAGDPNGGSWFFEMALVPVDGLSPITVNVTPPISGP
jgi:hypothetical protein